MGEVLTIRGSGFGQVREDGYVEIAGISPTASSYIEWNDTRISVRIPDFGESGLVYVHASGKKSNPRLFTNRASVPQPISSADEGIVPRILSIEPQAASIGGTITIAGRNFGAAREQGAVLFAWEAATVPSAPASVRAPDAIEASELEFCYEQWSDREIRVRVPDGAMSGNLIIRTDRGTSDPVFFEVVDRPGTKTYKDKKTYVFSYSADISVSKASEPNALFLWVPLPVSAPYQRNLQQTARSTEPFVESYNGASLFQFKDLAAGSDARVQVSYIVDSYAVETQIKATAIKKEAAGPVRSAYTLPTSLLPAENRVVADLAATIVGKERNPYLAAKRIYDWLLTSGGIQSAPVEGGALEAIAAKRADAYAASLLFCALSRASGIPAIPVAGYVVGIDRSSRRHWWAEFWIDGFGWVPVDPAFGAGAVPAGFTPRQNAAEYYFGNLDNQRIVFSRTQAELSPMDPRGKTVSRTRSYALQSIWEESVGSLSAYSSLWNDITVSGVY